MSEEETSVVVIRIQEQAVSEQQTVAIIRVDDGAQYTVPILDPFAGDPVREADLDWYFKEYLWLPFRQGVRAQRVVESLREYGEALFTQIFACSDVIAAYRQAYQRGLSALRIEIAGSADFHRLHWEALYDPELQVYLSLHASLIHKDITWQNFLAAPHPLAALRILLVVAQSGGRHIDYRVIPRPLVEELKRIQLPVAITILSSGTYQEFSRHLEFVTREYGVGDYHLVHFDASGSWLSFEQLQQDARTNRFFYDSCSGRGDGDFAAYEGEKAFLFLDGEQGDCIDLVEASELERCLIKHQVPMVLLNSCQPGGSGESILGGHLIDSGAGVQTVLGGTQVILL